ncbi:NUDIX hydrolase [Enterococcus sp. BWB1-3]|uniref:NUDIX hydrolase n=1 Tax=unclassified Enterococcus TaxID=2608891 RepID=UPI00192414BF|nr:MULTISPECIES: hypothetical protein [unclassified Enterococcus]MBL1228578.1 NUDIX hydrolase [Enterococcus sp. BWB1-3]MCB5955909.1 hypothetical protein [Enterococcus sp. CWB-B31]
MAENEQLKIFNQKYEQIGTASRAEAHEKGLWHETFHCWFYTMDQGDLIIYFQQRSLQKKDFPNQLDITAAGHLLSNESVLDGFREVEEELGVKLTQDEPEKLGVFIVEIDLGDFVDNEFTNVFVVNKALSPGSFYLQEEEVSGLYPIRLKQFKEIFYGKRTAITIDGISQKEGRQFSDRKTFAIKDFCANALSYYDQLILSFEKILENQTKTLD